MANTDKDALQKIPALMAKALQRGEKLERTLTKLVAQSDPGSATENLLKAVQEGLKAIRKSAKSIDAKSASKKTSKQKAGAKKAAKAPEKSVKRKAPVKKPAPVEITPPVSTNVSE